MKLEDYLEFIAPDAIRIKNTRVGIEIILSQYLNGSIPEEIAIHYPSVSVEQIYAAITYYWHNQKKMDIYLEDWKKQGERLWLEQKTNPPDVVKRLRAIAKKRRQKLLHSPVAEQG